MTDLYRRLLQAATDAESEVIEAVAERAGIIWRCACLWRNPENVSICERCNGKRDGA